MSWKPSPYAQTWALQRSEDEIHLGGNRGWGKTDVGMAFLVEEKYLRNKDYRALITRRNATDLSDWFDRAKRFYAPHKVKALGNPTSGQAELHFPTGAIFRLGHLRDIKALEAKMSHEYQKMLIEQAEQIPKFDFYQRLTMSCRSTIDGLNPQIMSNSNPGGPGHAWVTQYFVNSCKHKTLWDEYEVPGFGKVRRSRICIIGDVRREMAHKPDYVRQYVAQLMSIKDPVLREAWLEGNYELFTGQFFKWEPAVHTYIPDRSGAPGRIPGHWPRRRAMDWGYYPGYAAVGWYAMNPVTGIWYKYRELVERENTPEQIRDKIAVLSLGERYVGSVGDPSMWAKNQYGRGPYGAGQTSFSIASVIGSGFTEANHDRKSGWARHKDMLYYDANRPPRLVISVECPKTIQSYPQMQYNQGAGDPEDMAKDNGSDTDYGDHPIDCDRYFAMSATEEGDEYSTESDPDPLRQMINKLMEKAEDSENTIPEYTETENDLVEYAGVTQ